MGLLRGIAALCLAGAAGLSAQIANEVQVTTDAQSQETIYTASSGGCRISWIVSGTEINRGVVRHRAQCSLSFREQVPLIEKVMSRVWRDSQPRTVYWGRLSPDGGQDTTLAMRLALAARRSAQWDASTGRPRAGNENMLVRKLANDAEIYAELEKMFREHGLDIQVAAVEKVLVGAAGRLPFFERFPKNEVKAGDRLPYDCMVWLSISGRQR